MVLYLDILILALIALIPGLVIHSFIIGVNVNDWMRGRLMTPVDLILTSLEISRMGAQCALTIYLFVVTFYLKKELTQIIMDAVYAFYIYANTWLTSLLSIVFCVKISSLRTRLFLYLRRMIEHRTAHLIVALAFLSAMNSLLPLTPVLIEASKGRTYNSTMDNLLMGCIFFLNSLYSHTIGPIIPLLFCSISSVVLFTSLYHHTTKMKRSGNLSINLETYYSAMKFVSFTFIYNTIYFIGHFVCLFYYFLYCVQIEWLYILLGFLPALHSSYLICRTAKLRSQMSKVLHNVTGFLFQRKDPETREDIEEVVQ